jgi:NADH-quinone oxidoreductase subunit B
VADAARRHVTVLTPRAWVAGAVGTRGAVADVLDAIVDGVPVRLHLTEAGLACCAVEQSAGVALVRRSVVDGGPAHEDGGAAEPVSLLVVSGTVTDAMAPLIVTMYERLPEPRAVVAFGACACTGGPYWDSPVVTNGMDQLLPVAAAVPGCPPHPDALRDGIARAVRSAVGAPGSDAAGADAAGARP